MTNEETIEVLDDMKVKIGIPKSAITQQKRNEALDKAIKLLEQQPFEDILDKIRAEIEALEEGITSYHNDRPWIFKDEVLQIIDKYKEESENKE